MDEFSQKSEAGEGGSILRSIMIEQEEHDRVALDPLMVVASAVNTLKEREREVLTSRYGLASGEKETLDAVGRKFEITRERVRQIESAAIKKIANKPGKDLAHLLKIINSHLIESGGVMSLDELARYFKLSDDSRKEAELNAMRMLMAMNADVVALSKTDLLRTGWSIKSLSQQMLMTVAKSAESELVKAGKPLTLEELWGRFLSNDTYGKFADLMNLSIFEGILKMSEKLASTTEHRWGLVAWPTVVPKRIRDKVFLILQHANKPMHFRDISDAINKEYGGKPVLSRTVHNELIGDKRFVLVGRGIYGLQSMGFESGVVSDVIKKILDSASTPLSTDEIVEQVMQTRQVKRNTVIANLQNKDLFTKVGKGRYTGVNNK